MHSREIKYASFLLATAVTLFMSGCASMFVRSDSTVPIEHVYPATTIDAQVVWEGGVTGMPPLVMTDPDYRTGIGTRLLFFVCGIIDVPFSVVIDTFCLPFDLYSAGKVPEKDRTTVEEDSGDKKLQPASARAALSEAGRGAGGPMNGPESSGHWIGERRTKSGPPNHPNSPPITAASRRSNSSSAFIRVHLRLKTLSAFAPFATFFSSFEF